MPVDPKAMFLSVLQLVLAPVLIGCTINSVAPSLVRVSFLPSSTAVMHTRRERERERGVERMHVTGGTLHRIVQ